MKCPTCGNEVLPGRKFCGACGQSLLQPSGGAHYSPPSPSPYLGQSAPGASAGFSPEYSSDTESVSHVEKKYKALRIIASVYKVLAFIVSGFYVLWGLVALATGLGGSSRGAYSSGLGGLISFSGFFGAVLMFIFAAFSFIFFYGIAEFIYLFINIEENTRTTSEILLNRRQGE